jgi:hypothetical protein
MPDESATSASWQDEVVAALTQTLPEDQPIPLMKEATAWAVRGTLHPYYVVLVAGEGSQSLKVCLYPLIHEAKVSKGLSDLAQRPTGPQCLFLGPDFDAWASPDPDDEHSFLYTVTDDVKTFQGKPCLGHRFREHCRHVDAVPGESILRRA